MQSTAARSDSVSLNGHKTSVLNIPRLSFDLGNRFTAITDGATTISFPSYVGRLSQTEVDGIEYDSQPFIDKLSFVIQMGSIVEGVGRIAQFKTPGFATFKQELLKPQFYAGITAITDAPSIHVEELRCSVVDDLDTSLVKAFKELAAAVNFTGNCSDRSLVVSAVGTVAEGRAAWLQAKKDKLWKYPNVANGILDIGGGTAILRLIRPDGTIDREYSSVTQLGTKRLALLICKGMQWDASDADAVMDAIADGSFVFGGGFNFKAEYEGALKIWGQELRDLVRVGWQTINRKYGQVLVVGGSAPVFKSYLGDNVRWVFPDNPQTYSLRAMHNA